MASALIESHPVVLQDGRKVRVLAYADGSVRFRLDNPPYTIEEAFLSKGMSNHAIIKLTPRHGVAPAITDHPFTPWKTVPKRCNTCGRVASRHAVIHSA